MWLQSNTISVDQELEKWDFCKLRDCTNRELFIILRVEEKGFTVLRPPTHYAGLTRIEPTRNLLKQETNN
jgi:hypothetical protein